MDHTGAIGHIAVVTAIAFIAIAAVYSLVKYDWLMRLSRGSGGLPPRDVLTLAVARRAGQANRGREFCLLLVRWAVEADETARLDRRRRLTALCRRTDDFCDLDAHLSAAVLDATAAQAGGILERWRAAGGVGAVQGHGVASCPADGDTADQLLAAAEAAMERANAPAADDSRGATEQPADDLPPAELAVIDPLTGLLRPERMGRAARKFISNCRYRGRPVTVLHIDIDRLEDVNTRFGREAGDAVVAKCAEVLSASLRQGDLLGRLGGDEFLAILDCPPAAAELVARRLIQRVRESPAWLGSLRLPYAIRVGLAGIGGGGAAPSHVLDAAALALDAAQRQGPGSVAVYNRSMEHRRPVERPVPDAW